LNIQEKQIYIKKKNKNISEYLKKINKLVFYYKIKYIENLIVF
jgi:hypothetical protein